MKILYSEIIKTKRTPLRYITFLLPVLFSSAFLWYSSVRSLSVFYIHQDFFEIWTALFVPVMAGLLFGLAANQEENAGGFINMFCNNFERSNLYIGKFIFIALSMQISMIISIFIFGIGFDLILRGNFPWVIYIASFILESIGALSLLSMYMWISFAWGLGASIGFGGFGMLVAALMSTNLGNSIWMYIPWAWPVRLSELPGAYLLFTYQPKIISSGELINQIVSGVIFASLFFIFMIVGGIIWFKRWEGRKMYE
ncbi:MULTISPECIES: lantibiotic immunity ABC transporter MutG family permease subunit [Thermoanaerobacterium]|uniref:MutG family lantibiotic protection ABC transporter permease n=2 Tax=Thermoanaerobacterium TaxID=28895 RepID=W9EBW9_9THEO|nr:MULTISPECIES: lantibiotic immunity ABC transporter MutG family permease subunit [Thermoanaerobacterium]AFK87269.1 lantibiotic protection ABC transporter permease subunit, MutG family [Thermoanaerobacterium saccharolyticum JW/SL-YS485]ETO39567.1 MutG family lantibiotic protection ABC transporter permease [Thermoanaerobacterium aotearoense SCUT27]WHE06411.1 lantibiotic immunity ABC transporter MutG family permease subunit [Thermoanaerobacterium thermosaccharolyticum]